MVVRLTCPSLSGMSDDAGVANAGTPIYGGPAYVSRCPACHTTPGIRPGTPLMAVRHTCPELSGMSHDAGHPT